MDPHTFKQVFPERGERTNRIKQGGGKAAGLRTAFAGGAVLGALAVSEQGASVSISFWALQTV